MTLCRLKQQAKRLSRYAGAEGVRLVAGQAARGGRAEVRRARA